MSEQPEPSEGERPVDLEEFIHHTELPRTRVSAVLDPLVEGVGNIVSWIWVVLVAVIVVNVVLRYAFGQGRIEFEELQWHLYAVGWLIGLSYCVQNDSHIRIDIFHDGFKPRTKAWIDFFGILVFLIPYTVIVLIYSPSFIEYSFQTGEVSDAPGGLPYRWIVKSFMFIGFAFLLIAGVSRLTRAWAGMFGGGSSATRSQG